MTEENVDLSISRNLVTTSVIMIFGVRNMSLAMRGFELAGIGLAELTGIFLNTVLPKSEKLLENNYSLIY